MDTIAQYHTVHVSAITVMERMRGYALSIQRDPPDRRTLLALKRQDYLDSLGEVRPVDAAVAVLRRRTSRAAAPTALPAKAQSPHRRSRARNAWFRWRCDILIAATALAAAHAPGPPQSA